MPSALKSVGPTRKNKSKSNKKVTEIKVVPKPSKVSPKNSPRTSPKKIR